MWEEIIYTFANKNDNEQCFSNSPQLFPTTIEKQSDSNKYKECSLYQQKYIYPLQWITTSQQIDNENAHNGGGKQVV